MYKSISLLGLLSIIGLLCYGFISQDTDRNDLRQLQESLRKAPKIAYPDKDLKNRPVPQFDQLAVLPSCISCSTFRMNCAAAAKANPAMTFLILSPDTEKLEQFNVLSNCYVAMIPKSPEYTI